MSANYKCDGCGKTVNCEHVEIIDGKGLCRECSSKYWLQQFEKEPIKATYTPKSVDIHKIIDDAMEKKDRSVTIFIGKEGTTVSVYPYEDTPREWVPRKDTMGYLCPECNVWQKHPTNYCSNCGEKLKAPTVRCV